MNEVNMDRREFSELALAALLSPTFTTGGDKSVEYTDTNIAHGFDGRKHRPARIASMLLIAGMTKAFDLDFDERPTYVNGGLIQWTIRQRNPDPTRYGWHSVAIVDYYWGKRHYLHYDSPGRFLYKQPENGHIRYGQALDVVKKCFKDDPRYTNGFNKALLESVCNEDRYHIVFTDQDIKDLIAAIDA